MDITINQTLIDRYEKDIMVSRIPGMSQTGSNSYLYLPIGNILKKKGEQLVADIQPDKLYVIGGKNNDSGATMVRGESLISHYVYEKRFDPRYQQRNDNRTNMVKQEDRTERVKTATEPSEQRKTEPVTEPLNRSQRRMEIPAGQIPGAERNVSYSREQFRQLRLGQKHYVDITQYWNIRLSAEQMQQLRMMQENGIEVQKLGYNHPEVSAERLSEIREMHSKGYTPPENWQALNAGQLREVKKGMMAGVDTRVYGWPAYSVSQMEQLRLALARGYDVKGYRNPNYSASQMRMMRQSQVLQEIKETLRNLWEKFKQLFQNLKLNQIKDRAVEKIMDWAGMEETMQQRMVMTPEDTLDSRIKEAVDDIREVLASQELVPETVMTDAAVAEKMNQRIQEALQRLMQPDTIQNAEIQEKVINETADALVADAGLKNVAEVKVQEILADETIQEQMPVEDLPEETVINKAELYKSWAEDDIEQAGRISEKLLNEIKADGYQVVRENGSISIEEISSQNTLEQQAEQLMEQVQTQAKGLVR